MEDFMLRDHTFVEIQATAFGGLYGAPSDSVSTN